MKYLIPIVFIFINQFVYAQNNTNRKPVTIDGSEFESLETSKLKAEKQIQIKDSIDKAIADSIELADAKLMLIETEKAIRISDSLNNLLPMEAAPSEEMANFIVAKGLYNKAVSKFLAKDHQGALELLNQAIVLNPNDYNTFDLKASINAINGNYQDALEVFNIAINIDSTRTTAYTNRASLKNELSDYRGAIKDLTKAILIIESSDTFFYVTDQNGVEEKNKEHYKAELYTLRAESKIKARQYSSAVLDCNKAIQFFNACKRAFFNRGIAKIELNQKESGCLDLSKAGELGQMEAYEAIKEYCNK